MQRRSSRNISNVRRSVPSPDETLRRESSNHKVIVSTPVGSTQIFSSEPPVASSSHAGIFRGVVFPLPPPPPPYKSGGGGGNTTVLKMPGWEAKPPVYRRQKHLSIS